MPVYTDIPRPPVPTYQDIADFESLFLISIGNFLKINSDGDRLKVSSQRSTPEATDIPRPAVPTYTDITRPS